MGHRGSYKKRDRKHERQEAEGVHNLAVARRILESLLENQLKLASEKHLRSKDQEPAFIERRLELVGKVH